MISKSFYEANISLIQNTKDIGKNKKEKKKHYHSMNLMKVNTKFLNKILTNQIQKYMKKIIHYDQEVLSRRCKDSSISTNKSM